MILKQHSWKILAVILFIILLLCMWSSGFSEFKGLETTGNGAGANGNGDNGNGDDDDDIGEPQGGWILCQEETGVYDGMSEDIFDGTHILPIDCPYGFLRTEISRWWESTYDDCDFPCPVGVEWYFKDSAGLVWFNVLDTEPVTTWADFGGTPDVIDGPIWDGNPWFWKVWNDCPCTINQDWMIRVFHWQATGPGVEDEPFWVPGFELPLLLASLIVITILLKKRKE